jgi:glycosyltransferase involved in cell wall biosynthesis
MGKVRLSEIIGDLFREVQCIVDLTPPQWEVAAYLQAPSGIKYAHIENIVEMEQVRTTAGGGAASLVVGLEAKSQYRFDQTILKSLRLGDFCLVIFDIWHPGNLLATANTLAQSGLAVESINKVEHKIFETVMLARKIANDDKVGLLRTGNEIQRQVAQSWYYTAESTEDTKNEPESMAGDMRRLRIQLATKRKRLRAIEASLSFRLGNMIVQSLSKPGRNTVLLPYRVLRLGIGAVRARALPERSVMKEVSRATGKVRVLVNGHGLHFIDLLCEKFSDHGYDVAYDKWEGHNVHDVDKSRKLLDQANIIICEWCLGNAVWYSENKQPDQKLIIRLHLFERNEDYPWDVDMENVDSMIFVGPHIRREAIAKFGWERWAETKLKVIPNYINTEAFDLPKSPGARFNIGMVGILRPRKRLDLALDIIEKLRRKDERFHLYVKGKTHREYRWLRPEEIRYYEHQMDRIKGSALLKDAVHFDGWGSDMPEWYKKIGFILSVSDFESFHLVIAEGAASRAVPVALKWEGVEEIFPQDWSYNTTDEIANAILDIAGSGRFEEVGASRYAYVKENFDIGRIARLWLDIIEGTDKGCHGDLQDTQRRE